MDTLLLLDEEDKKKLYDGASIINHVVSEKVLPPTIKPSYESRSGLNACRALMGTFLWRDGATVRWLKA